MKIRAIACAIALAACTAAQAAPVTFNFTGQISDSEVAGYDSGSEVSGSFSYDPETAQQMDAQPLFDGFQLVTYTSSAINSLILKIGTDTLSFNNLNMVLLDGDGTGEGGEAFTIGGDGMLRNGAAAEGAVMLTFLTMGTDQSVLTGSLPTVLNLSDFDIPGMSPTGSFLTSLNSDGKMANFAITSVTAGTTTTPIPEPATMWSMLLGLGMVGGLMRARRAA